MIIQSSPCGQRDRDQESKARRQRGPGESLQQREALAKTLAQGLPKSEPALPEGGPVREAGKQRKEIRS